MPPRPLRPKDEGTSVDDVDSPAETKASKRRAVSSACIPCRKRKSKVSHQCCQSLERLTKKIFSVMAEHRHVLHVLLFIVQSASMTKTATTAEKVR
jgi:hypothetical protein